MALAINDLVDKCETLLLDTANDRFLAADLVLYANEAEKAIVTRKPDAYVKHDAFVLVEGTLQTKTGAIVIFDITRNMGTDGTTEGNAITKIPMGVLDLALPTWHTATASATVIHWMYNDKDPTHFHVYPPQPSENFGYVDGIWSQAPPAVTAGNNMNLADFYEQYIINYMMFKAHSMDGAIHAAARERAMAYAQMFLGLLGTQEDVEAFYSANAGGK